MEPLKEFTGIAAPLDRENVDTDAIVPKQFLKIINKTGFGKFLFYDWRYLDGEKDNPDFVLNQPNYRGASILLTRKNFGCGSSREHAPWALADYGFRIIIAPLFADIFYNNCFKNGILPIQLSEEEVQTLFEKEKVAPNYQISINLEEKVVYDHEGFRSSFTLDDYRRDMLLKGLDEIGMTIEYAAKIEAFEDKHPIFYQI
ncbi:3-isopropylmalate dehydratase small subunit [Bacillus sp. EB106-08-02-XG196]|jgi:3-isopropylmalate/(R)-2-methylmalate dehydratase small subunit|uniref:3-isopropylmalate dehydratase small subunit n=1 Tax=Bacillus sp. EB106-08-02-XG196 TaxID=2737049 RepID=UPI0015C45CE1|nr:3-isopropylmalate dehydratase small subunit [Bacillus sp. EB106-08-02-XG196]NWQ44587.1 3-isopropylmalate dehydratase small subunit [Bacillus sp. EB106-08-02-XG196]